MFFMVFEGLDGSGKSTLMQMLDEHLRSQSVQTLVTREPGGTPMGDELREIILKKRDDPALAPVPRAELLMYQASRAQHVDHVIRPALVNKRWVLCDRFSASSVAFQGEGRGISNRQVEWLNDFATGNLIPDVTVLLDLSVEESRRRRMRRQNQTGSAEDRIEAEKNDFHDRVRHGFLKQAEKSPETWLVLDAALLPETLFELLLADLRGRRWL